MKTLLTIVVLSLCMWAPGYAQTPSNIKVNLSDETLGKPLKLDRFTLNHTLYVRAFIVGGIYPTVSKEEMLFITNTLADKLTTGNRIQFIIKTEQPVDYRLAVMVKYLEGEPYLILLTNFDPKTGKLEKEIEAHFYATDAPIVDGAVYDRINGQPLKDKAAFEEKEDYLSLVKMYVFNGKVKSKTIDKLLEKAREAKVDNNQLLFVKAYYHLYQRDFAATKQILSTINLDMANLSQQAQTDWNTSLAVLQFELELLEMVEGSTDD